MNPPRHSLTLTLWAALATVLMVGLLPAAFASDAEILTVEGDVEKPVKLHAPAPAYPPEARKQHIQGQLVAKTVINTEGTVESVEIVQSLGDDFDAAVREVLKEWRFEPARLKGVPVAVYYHLTFNFRLDGDKKDTDAEG